MRQTKRNDRLIKWFFGISGVVDEHVRAEVGKVSTQALVMLFVFEMLFISGSYTMAAVGLVHDFESYLYIILMIQFVGLLLITGIFTIGSLRRKGVLNKEVTDKSNAQAIHRLRAKWLRYALAMFLLYWVLSSFIEDPSTNIFNNLFEVSEWLAHYCSPVSSVQ